jgi:hypothetical protein
MCVAVWKTHSEVSTKISVTVALGNAFVCNLVAAETVRAGSE